MTPAREDASRKVRMSAHAGERNAFHTRPTFPQDSASVSVYRAPGSGAWYWQVSASSRDLGDVATFFHSFWPENEGECSTEAEAWAAAADLVRRLPEIFAQSQLDGDHK